MTDGSSQGLFVIIAIVIFGIFVFISYLLFRDTMKPTLANVFCDSFEQVGDSTNLLDGSEGKCMGKFNNSHEVRYFNLGFIDSNASSGSTSFPVIWTNEDHSMRTINLKKYIDTGSKLNIVDNSVEVYTIDDNSVHVKDEFLEKGFGNDATRKGYFTINDEPEIYLGKTDAPNVFWGKNKHIKLKIGEVNTIKITYENVYGGKTSYTIQVKIVNE